VKHLKLHNMGQNIRSIIPTKCPHCDKPIFVELGSLAPSLVGVIREEDIKVAKEMARERIENSALGGEEKKQAIDMIDAPDTIFGVADVDAVVEDFLNQ